MTTDDLAEILRLAEVDPTLYNLFGPTADDGLCLLHRGPTWEVFLAERGQRYEERTFSTEDEACIYFLKRAFHFDRRKQN